MPSRTTLLEFSTVFWAPERFLDEYECDPGTRVVSRGDSARFREDLRRRLNELNEVLDAGGTVVAFVTATPAFGCYTGMSINHGTRASPRYSHKSDSFPLASVLPLQEVSWASGEGSRIASRGGGPYAEFWRQWGNRFIYRSYTEALEESEIALTIAGRPDMAVGGVVELDPGRLVLLPAFEPDTMAGFVDELDAQLLTEFVESALGLVAGLTAVEDALPAWANRWRLPGEQQAVQRSQDTAAEIATLERRLIDEQEQYDTIVRRKALFTASGRPLELAVAELFRSFGCEIEDQGLNRLDLLLRWKETEAVVEVKGVAGSAAEKHAAQLEKWVSEHLATTGRPAKGILVVNTFNSRGLSQRQRPFPAQMLPYAEARGHCLVTGLQLLGAALSVEAGELTAPEVMSSLLSTTGTWPDFTDHRQFLDSSSGKRP